MKINNQLVVGTSFAFDGCHKIYVCENDEDIQDAKETGYNIFNIENIENIYNNSCDLKFINNWNLTKTYVAQFEDAEFKIEKDVK